MNESIGIVLIYIGLFFYFTGCLGLIRLPDIYTQLQAGTKCVTLGTGIILFGAIFFNGFSVISVKALLCMWFISLTSPTAAHAIGRATHRMGFRLWEGSVCDKYLEDRNKAAADAAALEGKNK